MMGLIKLFIGLFICFFSFQTYQLYQQKSVIENDLSVVLTEYKDQKLPTEVEVRDRIVQIMGSHGVELNKEAFPLTLDEKALTMKFSIDYQKSPNLYVAQIPFSFHVDIPKNISASGDLIGGARKTIGGASQTQENKMEKLDEVDK